MTEEAKLLTEWLNHYIKTDHAHKVIARKVFGHNGDCGDYGEDWMWLDDICKQTVNLIESLSEQLEQITRERDAAVNELVKLEYPIPCESDELGGSEYCEENCRFKYPQKECWLLYFRECGGEVTNDAQKGSDAKS